MAKYAQQMPYWGTTIKPSKSRAEIDDQLRKAGARIVQITTGRLGNKEAWKITFEYKDNPFQLVFHPLEVKTTYRRDSTISQQNQALCQMGRFAFYCIKNLLIIAEQQPAALFGFLAISGPDGKPMIAADLGVEGMMAMNPQLEFKPDPESQHFVAKEDGEIINA